jgi:hypothetical protein
MLLRAEALIELALAVSAYRSIGGTWSLFAVLFLAPDVTMLGYLASSRTGACMYNAGHTYLAPALLALAGFMMGAPLLYGPALVWAAHIGFDRLLGYGLKYPAAFGATHLGWKRTRSGATVLGFESGTFSELSGQKPTASEPAALRQTRPDVRIPT